MSQGQGVFDQCGLNRVKEIIEEKGLASAIESAHDDSEMRSLFLAPAVRSFWDSLIKDPDLPKTLYPSCNTKLLSHRLVHPYNVIAGLYFSMLADKQNSRELYTVASQYGCFSATSYLLSMRRKQLFTAASLDAFDASDDAKSLLKDYEALAERHGTVGYYQLAETYLRFFLFYGEHDASPERQRSSVELSITMLFTAVALESSCVNETSLGLQASTWKDVLGADQKETLSEHAKDFCIFLKNQLGVPAQHIDRAKDAVSEEVRRFNQQFSSEERAGFSLTSK